MSLSFKNSCCMYLSLLPCHYLLKTHVACISLFSHVTIFLKLMLHVSLSSPMSLSFKNSCYMYLPSKKAHVAISILVVMLYGPSLWVMEGLPLPKQPPLAPTPPPLPSFRTSTPLYPTDWDHCQVLPSIQDKVDLLDQTVCL